LIRAMNKPHNAHLGHIKQKKRSSVIACKQIRLLFVTNEPLKKTKYKLIETEISSFAILQFFTIQDSQFLISLLTLKGVSSQYVYCSYVFKESTFKTT